MKLYKILAIAFLISNLSACKAKNKDKNSTFSNATSENISTESIESSSDSSSESTSTTNSTTTSNSSSSSSSSKSSSSSTTTSSSSTTSSSKPSSSSSSSSTAKDIILASGSKLFFDFEESNTSKNTKNYSNGMLTSKGYDFLVKSCMYDLNWNMESGDAYFGQRSLRFSNIEFTGEFESINRFYIAKLEIYAAKFNHSKESNSLLYLQTSSDKKTWKDLGPNTNIDHTTLYNYWWNINELVYFRINFVGYPGNNARSNLDNLSITFK